jgi:ABC-type transporter Mla MlaB component
MVSTLSGYNLTLLPRRHPGANVLWQETVGIFSLFGKKDRQQSSVAKDARLNRDSGLPADSGKRDAHAARATTEKIDAIESAMSSEYVAPESIPGNMPRSGAGISGGLPFPGTSTNAAQERKSSGPDTLSSMGTTTQFLMGETIPGTEVAVAASEGTALLEEAAILFANEQTDAVEQMLRAAISEDTLGDATREAWEMLFDFYQISGNQQQFDNLSIEYASKFETSPPAWTSIERSAQDKTGKASGAVPTVPLTGKLDVTSIKQLDRIKKLAESHRSLRLELARITKVDPVGCGLLLRILKGLQKSEHQLTLAGAPELATKIREILQVGRRDETEAPWLLLLEILRLLNREREFEEVSLDYCVTFEVSPPAFVAPDSKVTTAARGQPRSSAPDHVYMMPQVMQGSIDEIILGIAAFSDVHDPAIVDCSGLSRVDFSAAGRLMTGLAPFCGAGKSIEFHHVNALVAALFGVMGLKDIVKIVPRKR